MKNLFAIFVLLANVTLCFAADPVEGCWLSIDEKTEKVTAGWYIYAEGGKLYGKMLSMADFPMDALANRCKDTYPGFPVAGKVSAMPVIGTPWIFGLSMEKTGEWSGGSIVNPEDGKIYKCKIIFRKADGKKFKKDALEMRGEIGMGIGRSQYWQKTDIATASSLDTI